MNSKAFKFCFSGAETNDYIAITPDAVYNDTIGYGFDFGTSLYLKDAGEGLNELTSVDRTFYFSVKVPEGNYDVTVTLGNAHYASVTTVKAESRRLMLEKISTDAGQYIKEYFTVNVRNKGMHEIVRLNERELHKLNWDDRLTLEFSGICPCVELIEITRADDALTFFLAGDSTLVDQDNEPYASWGQMITSYFKKGLAVANHAESGLSLLSFINENRLNRVLNAMRPGDYLLVEFGHIDKKDKSADSLELYALRLLYIIQEVKKLEVYRYLQHHFVADILSLMECLLTHWQIFRMP